MRQFWLAVCLFFITACAAEAHEQDLLKSGDISRIMQQILNKHVQQKEITAQIMDSALDIFIDQFDPHRIYLLEGEVAPFLHYSFTQLNEAIEQYNHNDLSVFKQLNQVFKPPLNVLENFGKNLKRR